MCDGGDGETMYSRWIACTGENWLRRRKYNKYASAAAGIHSAPTLESQAQCISTPSCVHAYYVLKSNVNKPTWKILNKQRELARLFESFKWLRRWMKAHRLSTPAYYYQHNTIFNLMQPLYSTRTTTFMNQLTRLCGHFFFLQNLLPTFYIKTLICEIFCGRQQTLASINQT